MCEPGNEMLLIVIRRQPMIFRADEGLEKRPGLSGKLPEKKGLVSRQPCSAASERSADPPRDNRGKKPEAQYGPGRCERRRPRTSQVDHRGNGNDRGDPHGPVSSKEACTAGTPGVVRRIPFKQTLVRYQHS